MTTTPGNKSLEQQNPQNKQLFATIDSCIIINSIQLISSNFNPFQDWFAIFITVFVIFLQKKTTSTELIAIEVVCAQNNFVFIYLTMMSTFSERFG